MQGQVWVSGTRSCQLRRMSSAARSLAGPAGLDLPDYEDWAREMNGLDDERRAQARARLSLPDWYALPADPPPTGAETPRRGAALLALQKCGLPPSRPPPGLPGQEHGAQGICKYRVQVLEQLLHPRAAAVAPSASPVADSAALALYRSCGSSCPAPDAVAPLGEEQLPSASVAPRAAALCGSPTPPPLWATRRFHVDVPAGVAVGVKVRKTVVGVEVRELGSSGFVVEWNHWSGLTFPEDMIIVGDIIFRANAAQNPDAILDELALRRHKPRLLIVARPTTSSSRAADHRLRLQTQSA